MGQRLVISVEDKDDNILANAYYHWSGYTNSALYIAYGITGDMDESILNPKSKEERLAHILYLLFETGADIIPEEFDTLDKKFTEKYGIVRPDNADRNAGMIAVSEDGTKDLESWNEGIVRINADKKTVSFDVHYLIPQEDEDPYIEEWKQNPVTVDIESLPDNVNYPIWNK